MNCIHFRGAVFVKVGRHNCVRKMVFHFACAVLESETNSVTLMTRFQRADWLVIDNAQHLNKRNTCWNVLLL